MLFDLEAIQSIYGGSNSFGRNANVIGIGTIGDSVRILLNSLGSNNVVFDAPAGSASVRDGGSTIVLPGGALTGPGALRRMFRRA